MPLSNQDRQRLTVEKRIARIALMPKIPCECGCGEMIPPFNRNLRPIRYIKGHQNRVNPSPLKGKPAHNRIGDAPLTGSERTRRTLARRYAEFDLMPKIPCACGCGTLIPPINRQKKPATYAHGHQPGGEATQFKPGQTSPWKGKVSPNLVAAHRGSKHSPEHIAKTKASRLANNGGAWQVKRGWKHTDATRARMSLAQSGHDTSGENNPFFGKTHTPETRAMLAALPPTFKGKHHTPESRKRISDSITGAKHWNWKGGHASLPYGPEFTRKFKHLIRQRDNYTCQRCGKTQEQEGRVLQVHHLDHDKMHNDPSNLVTSCGSCNVWASYHRDEPFSS